MNLKLLKQKSLTKAFTLVETVLAMGIVSFAMLGILGLVPLGLSNFRDAISFTAESQIVQSLSNDILLTDYDVLVDEYSADKTQYYDDEGKLVEAGDRSCQFTVRIGLKDVSAPDVLASAGKTALIEITNIKYPQVVKKYSLIVPKG